MQVTATALKSGKPILKGGGVVFVMEKGCFVILKIRS
jgi:hypothetical protein